MAKVKTRSTRALSASFVVEADSKNQVVSVTSADADRYIESPVSGKTQLHSDNIARSDAIAYPIPPRRTKKLSKYRSSSCSTIFEGENTSLHVPAHSKGNAQPLVYKRPISEQRSNPEFSCRTRPPRPPPPAKPMPPRTFLDPAAADKTRMVGKRHKSEQPTGQVTIIVDTRDKRRHSDTVQPKRPPLPYETFVRQKESHRSGSSCSSDADNDLSTVDTGADKIAPADYEVIVPVGARLNVSPSGNRTVNFPSGKLRPHPVGGNETMTAGNEEEHLYSTISEERTASPYCVPNDHNEVFRESDSLVKALAKCEVSNSKPNVLRQGCTKQERDGKKDFSLKTDMEGDERQSLSSEEGVDCEPIYIEMNPSVYIAPPKDYKPKRRFRERHK